MTDDTENKDAELLAELKKLNEAADETARQRRWDDYWNPIFFVSIGMWWYVHPESFWATLHWIGGTIISIIDIFTTRN